MHTTPPEREETRRFTVDEVLKMVEVGILREDEPLELIGGRLIVVPPQGPEHAVANTDLRDRLLVVYRDLGHVREEKPLRVSDTSLPEPDLAVVRGAVRDYAKTHPQGPQAILVIETAMTSQRADHQKAAEYARGGVPVYWLVDLAARRLEVHTEPQPDGRYRLVGVLGEDDEVELPETDVRWHVGSLFL
jgi:Uma2 family endonuclease